MREQFKHNEIKRFNELADILGVSFRDAVGFYKLVNGKPIKEKQKQGVSEETEYLCGLWLEAKDNAFKNYISVMYYIEESIHYSIKNDLTENASAFFDYENDKIILSDTTLGIEKTIKRKA